MTNVFGQNCGSLWLELMVGRLSFSIFLWGNICTDTDMIANNIALFFFRKAGLGLTNKLHKQ